LVWGREMGDTMRCLSSHGFVIRNVGAGMVGWVETRTGPPVAGDFGFVIWTGLPDGVYLLGNLGYSLRGFCIGSSGRVRLNAGREILF